MANKLLRFLWLFCTLLHEFFNSFEPNGHFISKVDSDIRDSNDRDGLSVPVTDIDTAVPFVCPAVTIHLINQYLCSHPPTTAGPTGRAF
jgi:hypothetical protein